MKTIKQVVAEVERRLASGWHVDVCGVTDRWPHRFPIGEIAKTEDEAAYRQVREWSHAWHDWKNAKGLTLELRGKRLLGLIDNVPSHLVIPDVDTAARIAGPEWVARVSRGRQRRAKVTSGFPGVSAASVVRLADALDDVDFGLALMAGAWFRDTPAERWQGLTPRQVPVEGLQAKWLEKNRALVRTLAGLPDLVLAERPTRVYWTYVDPAYRSTGARLHDSLTIGDNVPLPYDPSVIVIVENKDTAVLFPELAGGIVVEGNGNAATGLLPQVPWIASAMTVIYWGDMDGRGYEIVDGLRAGLPELRTILMDQATFTAYEQFGTNVDERNLALKRRPRKPLPLLTKAEREVYLSLTDPAYPGYLRIEQERIPLAVAVEHVRSVV